MNIEGAKRMLWSMAIRAKEFDDLISMRIRGDLKYEAAWGAGDVASPSLVLYITIFDAITGVSMDCKAFSASSFMLVRLYVPKPTPTPPDYTEKIDIFIDNKDMRERYFEHLLIRVAERMVKKVEEEAIAMRAYEEKVATLLGNREGGGD